jgi:hypothetical protein
MVASSAIAILFFWFLNLMDVNMADGYVLEASWCWSWQLVSCVVLCCVWCCVGSCNLESGVGLWVIMSHGLCCVGLWVVMSHGLCCV